METHPIALAERPCSVSLQSPSGKSRKEQGSRFGLASSAERLEGSERVLEGRDGTRAVARFEQQRAAIALDLGTQEEIRIGVDRGERFLQPLECLHWPPAHPRGSGEGPHGVRGSEGVAEPTHPFE